MAVLKHNYTAHMQIMHDKQKQAAIEVNKGGDNPLTNLTQATQLPNAGSRCQRRAWVTISPELGSTNLAITGIRKDCNRNGPRQREQSFTAVLREASRRG